MSAEPSTSFPSSASTSSVPSSKFVFTSTSYTSAGSPPPCDACTTRVASNDCIPRYPSAASAIVAPPSTSEDRYDSTSSSESSAVSAAALACPSVTVGVASKPSREGS